jgi:hypothetical protein
VWHSENSFGRESEAKLISHLNDHDRCKRKKIDVLENHFIDFLLGLPIFEIFHLVNEKFLLN